MKQFLRWWVLAGGLMVGLIALGSGATEPVSMPLTLAEVYQDTVDPAPYWVSEKLDGVRAQWDGQTLRFRSGRPIAAPAWFVASLPKAPLDGELWMGRGQFERLSGAVRKGVPVDAEWRQVSYEIFELPGAAGDFTDRIAAMRRLAAFANRPWIHAVEQFRVADRAELQRILAAVVAQGGEGLMLHRADAPFVSGRSAALLKLKPWLDAEAVVIAHQVGQGKHRGRLGALRVQLPNGIAFDLGTGFSDAERAAPPPIGSTVTYRYTGLTADGVPRFASFWRRRAAE
jgi:DNA ligase 1